MDTILKYMTLKAIATHGDTGEMRELEYDYSEIAKAISECIELGLIQDTRDGLVLTYQGEQTYRKLDVDDEVRTEIETIMKHWNANMVSAFMNRKRRVSPSNKYWGKMGVWKGIKKWILKIQLWRRKKRKDQNLFWNIIKIFWVLQSGIQKSISSRINGLGLEVLLLVLQQGDTQQSFLTILREAI